MASGRRSVAITAAANFVAPLVGLFTAPMLASALGATQRGELAATTATLMLGANVATLGLPEAMTYFSARKGARHRGLSARVFAVLGSTGILCSLGIFLVSDFLSSGNEQLAHLISMAGLAVSPALLLAGLRGVASGFHAWNLILYDRLINSGLRFAAISITFFLGVLTLEVATAIMVLTTVAGVLAYVSLPNVAKSYEPTSITDSDLKTAFSFGVKVWVGSLTGVLVLRLDQALMVPLAGAQALGIYTVAVSISEMTELFKYAVGKVMYSREAQSPDSTTLAMAARITSSITYIGCAFVGVLSIWIVPLLFGKEFADVVPVVWILLVGVAAGTAGSVASSGLTGRGRPEMRSISLAVALVFNVVSLLVLAPHLGAQGAAVATTLANIVSGNLNLLWLKLLFHVRIRDFLGLRRNDVRFLAHSLSLRRNSNQLAQRHGSKF